MHAYEHVEIDASTYTHAYEGMRAAQACEKSVLVRRVENGEKIKSKKMKTIRNNE